MLRIVNPSLVVLIGPSGSGKSTWAASQFPAHAIVSSDALRGLVGEGEHDQRAGTDAFALLDDIVQRRLKRKLLTVVDTLGFDEKRRAKWRALADDADIACVEVAFDTPEAECRARNRARSYQVPAKVLTQQFASYVRPEGAVDPDDVTFVGPAFANAPSFARMQRSSPVPLKFGLQINRFPNTADALARLARIADQAGIDSLWVMDHFLQIPQAGREWEDMLDSYTTLAFLAAHTSRATLGTLVTGVTYRNVAHLAKIVATLDVLSNGRAVCGLGAAWFEREHRAYGWRFPPVRERFELLEDALELLPVMWGKGSPTFTGRSIGEIEAICYPRPVQEHVPILVGGGGERRTLKLVATHADACNLFGDPAHIAHKLAVLRQHCANADRDPSAIEVTHLSTFEPDAATITDHVGRLRELADAGVQHAIANVRDLDHVSRLIEVIEMFRS